MTYILNLNIAAKIEAKKTDIPILVYRITYEAERYNLENYYSFIEDQRVLDADYMNEFKEAIAAEQAALEAEREAEEQAEKEEQEQAEQAEDANQG